MGDAVGLSGEQSHEEDAFVGFFQSFRPDGNGLTGIFEGVDVADELHERLAELFEVAGDDRRPQGGRDAYFVVRSPDEIAPQLVEMSGERWIARLQEFAEALGHPAAAEKLAKVETVRVLEGIPPKHPKQEHDKTDLLKLLKDEIPTWIGESDAESPLATSLRSPYYFITCDAMLRDYLMWPLYRHSVSVREPMEPYFQLWKHGVKWRVYQEKQVDLYIPRRPSVEPDA
jgi:hypothetical protein